MNLFAVCIVLIMDQASKYWAKGKLGLKAKDAIPGRLYFLKTRNYGFSNNLMAKDPHFVKLLSTAVLSVSFLYALLFMKAEKPTVKIGFSFMLGGGSSNLLDRYIDGYVTDFICLGDLKKRRTVVYNGADFFIFFGGLIFVIGSVIGTLKDAAVQKKC